MTREEFDAKRWKLQPWKREGTRWTLGGYDVFKVNGRWKAEGPTGERYPGELDSEVEAKDMCERIIIQELLSSSLGVLEEA